MSERYRVRLMARRARPGPASTQNRRDPDPSSAPFPKGRFIFLVGYIPEHPGGRSASILNRARLFKEQAGVDAEIVVTGFAGNLDALLTTLRGTGVCSSPV